MTQRDPTQRFSDRAEDYAKYRPGYPGELYALLQPDIGLKTGSPVADLGSGTGLLTKLFLDHGHRVYAVEPNAEMRRSAETQLAGEPNFVSVPGRAEATTLPAQCVDLVVAGQAFHWFDPAAARLEIQRILRPGEYVALIWNRRDLEGSEFMRSYEALLEQFGTDYAQVDQQRTITDESIAAFFAPLRSKKAALPNKQVFDAQGLRGRLLSSSYTPSPGHDNFAPMLAALGELFDPTGRCRLLRLPDGNLLLPIACLTHLIIISSVRHRCSIA